MSLWDRYFAPGDLRQRRNAETPTQPPNNETPQLVVIKPSHLSQTDRARRQNGLFYGGVAFTLLSLVVTRRAVGRKLAQTAPKTTTPSASPGPANESKADASLEAVQALGYATLNVFSMAMLGMGFAMKYFDFADVEDLREMVRRQDGYSEESAANKEIEGWIAEVLARKDGQGNLREGVAERVAEIERKRKEDEQAAGIRR